jgi:muramoyltetrapeptide carboxypeptidase LdcA involved in peptidoglycan recycling
VFERLSALVLGRARGYTEAMKRQLEQRLVSVVADEFGCSDLPIVANFDVGHTDPQYILPLGIEARVDCEQRSIELMEPAVL